MFKQVTDMPSKTGRAAQRRLERAPYILVGGTQPGSGG